jgi:hypothetical protein
MVEVAPSMEGLVGIHWLVVSVQIRSALPRLQAMALIRLIEF